MKKFVAISATFAVIFCVITACGIVDTSSIATVNSESIKLTEFNYYLETSKSVVARAAGTQVDEKFWTTADIDGKKAGDVAKEKALDEAVKDVLVAQKAKELGITLDEKAKQEVGKQKGQFIEQFGGKDKYEAEIKKYNITDADITMGIQRSYLRQKLLEKLTKEDATFKIDDSALKTYIEKNYVWAKHILIRTVDESQKPLPEDAQKAAKDKADKLLADIKAGASFVKLMQENSEDPGLQSQPDGYVFTKGEMVKEFEDTTFNLKEGEISGIVKTSFGYHIIKREKMADKVDSFIADAQNKGKVEAAMQTEVFNKKTDEWKKSAKIDINQNQLKSIVLK